MEEVQAKMKKPFYKKWWVWVIAIIVIIGVSNANKDGSKSTSNSNGDGTKTTTGQTQANKEEDKKFKVGDKITTGKYEITIISVEEKSSVGSKYAESKPADGGVYVAVKWEYKNISNEPIGAFSFPKLALQDAKGTKYSEDLSASVYYSTEIDKNRKALSDLNPGIKVIDGGVFEISKETYANIGWDLLVEADKKNIVNIK